jgi:hypothetical protein
VVRGITKISDSSAFNDPETFVQFLRRGDKWDGDHEKGALCRELSGSDRDGKNIRA